MLFSPPGFILSPENHTDLLCPHSYSLSHWVSSSLSLFVSIPRLRVAFNLGAPIFHPCKGSLWALEHGWRKTLIVQGLRGIGIFLAICPPIEWLVHWTQSISSWRGVSFIKASLRLETNYYLSELSSPKGSGLKGQQENELALITSGVVPGFWSCRE